MHISEPGWSRTNDVSNVTELQSAIFATGYTGPYQYCFRAGEAHAQLRSECGSYIVRARSLTKLATSAPDQLCEGSLFLMQISSTGSFGRKIHTNLLCQDCFCGGFRPKTLSTNQFAFWWSRPELNRRTRSFNPLLYRLSYRTI